MLDLALMVHLSLKTWVGAILDLLKSLLRLLPSYLLCVHMCTSRSHHGLPSQGLLQMLAPRAKVELGLQAFKCSVPSAWNDVQRDLKLSELVNFKGNLTQFPKMQWPSCLGHCNYCLENIPFSSHLKYSYLTFYCVSLDIKSRLCKLHL